MPQFDAVTVSPDGEHLAALVGTDRGRQLVVMSRGRTHARVIPVDHWLRGYRWATDTRLLLSIGRPWRSPGIAAVNRDGREYRVLIAPGPDAGAAVGARVMSTLPEQPAEVLVALDERQPFAPDVFRLNVFDGGREPVANNSTRLFRWFPDARGRLRAGLGWEPAPDGLRYVLWHRFLPDGPWRRLHDFPPGGPAMVPLAFAPDGRELLVASSVDRDTAAVRRLDPVTGRLGNVLFGRPEVDVDDVALGPMGVTLVRWEHHRPDRRVFDAKRDLREEWLDGRLPSLKHRSVSASRDGRFAVVMAWSDFVPGRYYLHDRKRSQLTLIGSRRPWLEGRLPQRAPIAFKSRDGVTLQGYLTRPVRVQGRVPLLVVPHGGPWARDHWGFDAAAQFFASRGWQVLQVNFRGSEGFGRAHLDAGRGEWDGLMLRDLADGVDWAVRSRRVNPERVCILGVSFGGYAALMSAVRFPETYRCAVAFAPVTDLAARIGRFRDEGNLRAYHEWRYMVGDPAQPGGALVDASPLNHARALELPVMIGHGRRDHRVPFQQSLQMAWAMQRAGHPPRTLWLPEVGHDMHVPAARVAFHRAALEFINAAVGYRGAVE